MDNQENIYVRLVNADAVKKAIQKTEYFNEYVFGFICDVIDNVPTINDETYRIGVATGARLGYEKALKDLPTGEWIIHSTDDGTNYHICSECNHAGDSWDNFCRNCGKKMQNVVNSRQSK